VNGSVKPGWSSFGSLALDSGKALPLQVCPSAAGFYIGTLDTDGAPYSRESEEYWPTRPAAETALSKRSWKQRPEP
jgi:hypothetical protein